MKVITAQRLHSWVVKNYSVIIEGDNDFSYTKKSIYSSVISKTFELTDGQWHVETGPK